MSSDDESRKGICIFSLDSGGPGTYSQLLILKEYMSRLASDLGVSEEDVYPADHFDLIGGVGFGGLVAVMLGLLRMSVNQATEEAVVIASAIFRNRSRSRGTVDQTQNSHRLKQVIQGLILAEGLSLDAKVHEPSRPISRCRVALYAATSTDLNHVHIFRSYSHRGSDLNPTIIEAVCATMSIPSHFLPVTIRSRRGDQNFVGGPLGTNNPTRELLREAGTVFGNDTRVSQIISIGCGTPHALSLEGTRDGGVSRLLRELAVDCQMVAKDLSTRLFNVEGYLRLDVEKGLGGIEFDDWSLLGDIESHTGTYVGNATVSSSIDSSLQHVRCRVGTITLGQLNQSSSIKVAAKTVPPVSTHHVVRIKPFGIMVHHLVTVPHVGQRIFTITGMGGCGKTQLVAYFFQEYPSLYTRVVFIDASSSSSIKADYQTWARALGDGHERDVWEDGLRILSSVPQDERWALVLDNADDPTLNPVSFIPTNDNMTVILTSRNPDLGILSTTYHLELGEMEQNEALATLLHAARRELPISPEEMESARISPEEMESARTLVKELGYLALALVQAGTYCHQFSARDHGILRPYTFAQYLSLFYKHRGKLMTKPQPFPLDHYERGVYTTLDLSYRAIPQLAREFLHFLSFFHHTDIPLAALAMAASNSFADKWSLLPRPEDHGRALADLAMILYEDRKWNELRVQGAIQNLHSFSLISATPTGNDLFLQIHPLIQAWSRDMVSSTSQQYKAMAMQTLTSCNVEEARPLYRWILPHILDILGQTEIQDIHVHDLMAMGGVLRAQGHYQKATKLIEAALEKMMDSVDRRGEETLMVSASLASLYWDDGRWSEAERLEVDVLEQQRRILGVGHPHTIFTAANLAVTYRTQGRWSEAEKLHVDVLEQRRTILGVEHPDTIRAAANLAVTYGAQGRWSEAEKLEVDVLEQQRRILGMEHPHTIFAAANLAVTYDSQGRWSEAEKLEVDVLEQRRRVLGMEHPETILAASNLAVTYGSQDRFDECVELLAPAVKLYVKVLGQQHPWTQHFARILATVYEELDRHQEAEETRALLLS